MAKDKDITDHIENLFAYATAGVSLQRRKWVTNYQYWKGTNKLKRPSYRDNPRVPLIFRYTNGIISLMTAQNPKFIFLPQEESDVETADTLQQVIGDYEWETLKMSKVSEDFIWYAAAISGSSLLKWGIDRKTDEKYVKALNSFCCYPDPGARELDQMSFFDHCSMWGLQDIRNAYPERGKEVKEQSELNKLPMDMEAILAPWSRSSGKSENLIGVLDKEDMKKDYGRAMVHEMWEKDSSTEKIPEDMDHILEENELIRQGQMPKISEEDHHPAHIALHKQFADNFANDESVPDDQVAVTLEMLIAHLKEHVDHPNAESTHRLKYPRGKTTIVANGIILEAPKASELGLAMTKMDFIRNPLEFWGQTLVEYGLSLQDSRERRKRQISDHADRTANPREFFLKTAGYDPQKVKNVAGEQVGVNQPNSVWWEQTPAMNAYVFEDMIDSERTLEKVMMYPAIMQGEKPPGQTSGVLIAELKESLAPEVSKAVRHYEWSMIDCSRGLIELMEYESPTKMYLITGKKPGEQIRIYRDQLNLGGEYDIRVIAGSSLPTSRLAKESMALVKFEKGMYDLEAALKYTDDPQKDEILERMSENKQLKQVNEEQNNLISTLAQQNEQLKQMIPRGEDYATPQQTEEE